MGAGDASAGSGGSSTLQQGRRPVTGTTTIDATIGSAGTVELRPVAVSYSTNVVSSTVIASGHVARIPAVAR